MTEFYNCNMVNNMNKFFISLFFSLIGANCSASTWCTFSNFNVSVTGNFAAVQGADNLALGDEYVYLADLRTEKGRAIYSLLLSASILGQPVKYGNNSSNWSCGSLPGFTSETADPEYVVLMTKK